MSQSHEKPLDRLLRYSPWAAAALVAICFASLVARVAMYAGAADRQALSASATETVRSAEIETARSESHPSEPNGQGTQGGLGSSTDLEGSRVRETTALEGRRTRDSAALEVGRGASIRRTLTEPATPSAKSRLQIHSVREELAADAAASPQKRSDAKRSTATAAAIQALSQQGRRMDSLDGRTHTSFFGLEAYGRRFAYVLDRSGSMGDPDNKPLAAAKRELLTSLARLGDTHQFFILFYNEEPAVFNPGGAGRQSVFADDVTKNSARRFVERVQAHGGTRHYEALAKAISLRPDVIFVLTDGEPKDDLSDEELARLRRSNGGLAQIHVVQFAASPYEGNSLVRLARENRGQHRYTEYRDH